MKHLYLVITSQGSLMRLLDPMYLYTANVLGCTCFLWSAMILCVREKKGLCMRKKEKWDEERASVMCSSCVTTCVSVCVGGGWWSYEENIWICFYWCAAAGAAVCLVCSTLVCWGFALLSLYHISSNLRLFWQSYATETIRVVGSGDCHQAICSKVLYTVYLIFIFIYIHFCILRTTSWVTTCSMK